MAPDLLSTISLELDERLGELRPLLGEYERLLMAMDVLAATAGDGLPTVKTPANDRRPAAPVRSGRRRSSAETAEAASETRDETAVDGRVEGKPVNLVIATRRRASAPRAAAKKPKRERAARGAAREAILAALGHGSHTVGELTVVTAMSSPNINGNLRKLLAEGAVARTEREGKAAWALTDAAG